MVLSVTGCIQDSKGETTVIYDVLTTVAGTANFTQGGAGTTGGGLIGPALGIAFENGNGRNQFQDGDNIRIKKVRWLMPYSFANGEKVGSNNYIGLSFFQAGNTFYPPELGQLGILYMPGFCKELEPEIRISAPNVGGGNFQLRLDIANFWYSNIGIPADLLGQTIYFGVQIEVEHTLEMVI